VISLDDYHALKRQVEQLRKQQAEKKGALQQVLKRLKEDFGVSNLKRAKRLLAKYKEEELQVYEEYTKKKEEFEKEFKDVLTKLEEDDE
jgi:phenylalanyl-tRNA synthetase alpha subunit